MTQIWVPSQKRQTDSNITHFTRWFAKYSGEDFKTYDDLWQYSVDKRETFWTSLLEYSQVISEGETAPASIHRDKMPGARFFPNLRLNFAENLLKRRDDKIALDFYNENLLHKRITYADLNKKVARLQKFLINQGVKPGDRVAGYLPNIPETVIAMLATTSLGAVWASASPDFGIQGITDRFTQLRPKVLFATDGYFYGGQRYDIRDKVKSVLQHLPDTHVTVIVPYLTPDLTISDFESPTVLWDDALNVTAEAIPTFTRLPFNDPLYVLFSSGTTGKPKCITHGIGGTLLQHLKELTLHSDLKPEDNFFYFTTCGWMMWNWLVSGLAQGATLVLYDGSPAHPHTGALFDLIDRAEISLFGTSAKYIATLEKAQISPIKTHKLARLRTIFSTGSPLLADSFNYIYTHVKPDICLSSISGGTDIISCFALGNPTLPVHLGEIQCFGLGMNIQILDHNGRAVPKGEKGELVCSSPFPSMPIGLWGDSDGSKYFKSYFNKYPNTWHHSDFASREETGGLTIYGRSDTTLNSGGIRIGTAEIYRQVEGMPFIKESVVVSQPWESDTRIILFVSLKDTNAHLTKEQIKTIKTHIRTHASPHHVPAKIIAVSDIPRTLSGKTSEMAVRNTILGLDVDNTSALMNPESLALYRDIPELQS